MHEAHWAERLKLMRNAFNLHLWHSMIITTATTTTIIITSTHGRSDNSGCSDNDGSNGNDDS